MPVQLRKIIPYALAGWIPGGRKRCIMCEHHVWRFMPYRKGSRSVSPLMHALGVVGSDVDHFECPHCGAHDRERHLLMYLRANGFLNTLAGKAVLHFAPEKHLSKRIRQANPTRYLPCDLCPRAPDIERVDMQSMALANASFDLVIANHVLEHVEALDRALSEIHRVLKPGGHAILQTPYSPQLHHTWEDAGIRTPQARLQAFGQEDHVRLFGQDIFEIIAGFGFEPCIQTHAELLAEHDSSTLGVNSLEPFFLFQKNA